MFIVRLIILTLSLALSGCFYLVEQGKGGVAERYPIPSHDWSIAKRIHNCEAAFTEHQLQGKTNLYPALYKATSVLLTQSRRLYKAEYFQQAELAIEPVEHVLQLMHKNLYVKAAHQLCTHKPTREVCL